MDEHGQLEEHGQLDEHGQLEYATASGNDYPSHEQMYHTFVTLTKTFVAVIAVICDFPHLNAELRDDGRVVGCDPRGAAAV
jgi:hypothetical protein